MAITDCGEGRWPGDVDWLTDVQGVWSGIWESWSTIAASCVCKQHVPCLPRKQKRSGRGHYWLAGLARTARSSAKVLAFHFCCMIFTGWLALHRGRLRQGVLGKRLSLIVISNKGGSPGHGPA